MKTYDPGHAFFLKNYSGYPKEPPIEEEQSLIFMHRVGERYPGNDGAPYDGTNCQEVIRALIARSIYLNNQIPSVEIKSAIYYLRRAIFAFELRAARIKNAKLPEDMSLDRIETFIPCPTCGHIYIHNFNTCHEK